MRYMIIKYVDADSQAQALKKARTTPIHEITIHNSHWEKAEFSLKNNQNKRIGFSDGKAKSK